MLLFDEASHAYTLDGQVLPSVTQVLKDVGIIDVSQPWYTDWHRDRGKMAHKALELFDLGELDCPSLDSALSPYLGAWIAFKEQSGCEVVQIERRESHAAYGFAGTVDRVLMLCGALTVADIKLGPHERWHGLQTAAYKMLLPGTVARVSVHLRDDATYRAIEHSRIQDHDDFLAALRVYNFKRRAT